MGIGSPRLQRQLVSAVVVLVGSLVGAPHAGATLGVAEQAAAVVQAAPATVSEAVAQPSAQVAQVVETAQATVAAPVAAARQNVRSIRPVHRVAPVVRDVAREAVRRVAPVLETAAPTAVKPLARTAAAAPEAPQVSAPHRVAAQKPRAAARSPRAGVSHARTVLALPTATKPALSAVTPRTTEPAQHGSQLTLRPLKFSSVCLRGAGAVSSAAGGSNAGAALDSPRAPALPFALERLVAPLDAPRSHVSVLCLERPD